MIQASVSIDFYGLPLVVTGDYAPSEPAQWNGSTGIGYPGSDAEFYYLVSTIEGLPEADIESLLTHAHLIEELEQKCAEKLEGN